MDTQPVPEDLSANSKGPLPPAALRLESLDFDALGNPYYKFPPFLSPPDGVKLIPFEDFRPHGIQITLDSDQEELDGEGIATVELGTKHNSRENGDKRKRKKKTKTASDLPKKYSPWWDDWAEGEDLRTAKSLDPNMPRIERFKDGALGFTQTRKLSPGLQSLYDHFRLFSGLLGRTKRDKYGKGGEAEADEADDEEDDEAEFNAEGAATAQDAEANAHPEPVIDVDREEYTEFYEEKDTEETDLRVDAFLNDPETSIKVFFSSVYKDRGLAWSESKLRDGPILLSFFLSFFVRNHIMPDYDKAFRAALKTAGQARLELPQTSKISMSLPDLFGRGCTALWGIKKPQGWTSMEINTPFAEPAPPPATEPASHPEPVKEWEAQLQERGLENIDIDLAIPPSDAPSGWGEPMVEDPVTDGWDAAAAEGPMVGGWGDGATIIKDDTANPWAASADTARDWSGGESMASLMQVLGPTTLPLTHGIRRAEKSTRQIVAFAPPRAGGAGLERVLGTVDLAPWTRYHKGTLIARPEILEDSGAPGTFDPAKDVIRAFIDPEVVEVLREGMGLHGLFVEVVQNEESEAPKEKKKSKSRGKTRGKAKGADDREWWYVEFLYEVLPSFWAEEAELE